MKKKLSMTLFGVVCSCAVVAGTLGEGSETPPVYFGAYGGYGNIDGSIGQDGNFTQFRFSLGSRAPWTYLKTQIGGELGVQWGNTMRLKTSDEIIALNGDLALIGTLKPIVDALITLKYQFKEDLPLNLLLKGGIAYRQLGLEGLSYEVNNLSKVNGEFQAGLSYRLSEHAQITAMYQGIYSESNSNAQYTVDATSGYFETVSFNITQIPTQQSGFLGIEYTF